MEERSWSSSSSSSSSDTSVDVTSCGIIKGNNAFKKNPDSCGIDRNDLMSQQQLDNDVGDGRHFQEQEQQKKQQQQQQQQQCHNQHQYLHQHQHQRQEQQQPHNTSSISKIEIESNQTKYTQQPELSLVENLQNVPVDNNYFSDVHISRIVSPNLQSIEVDERNSTSHDRKNKANQKIHTTSAQSNGKTVGDTNNTADQVPWIERERQILILMLLAQVCALHDPTPRTFTIHVLELYERAILDHESIRFLYDLGLVPQTTPTSNSDDGHGPTRASIPSTKQTKTSTLPYVNKPDRKQSPELRNENNESIIKSQQQKQLKQEIVATATSSTVFGQAYDVDIDHSRKELLRQRSLEASAIRSRLSFLDTTDENYSNQRPHIGTGIASTGANDVKRITNNEDVFVNVDDDDDDSIPRPSTKDESATYTPSWSVKEHQLSLSRYQREFKEICLLSSGAFGLVYKAINLMDQREYAIKQIQFNATGYNRDSLQRTMREVHCLAICDHPNIVRYYTSWCEPSWMTGATTTNAISNSKHLPALAYDIEEEDADDDDVDTVNDTDNGLDSIFDTASRRRSRSSDIADELKTYFKYPFYNSTSNGVVKDYKKSKRKANTFFFDKETSVWTNDSSNQQEIAEDDDDVSDWSVSEKYRKSSSKWRNPLSSWKQEASLLSSRDDIYFEESITSQRRSQFNGNATNWERSIDDGSIFDRSDNTKSGHDYGQLIVHPGRKDHQQEKHQKHQKLKKDPKKGDHLGTRYKYQICLFIQMQLCHPATLADWIRERNQNRNIASESTIDDRIYAANQVFRQIACGLNHVHQKGIVHRDLKPSNIFFCATDDGTELQFKIGDFGLSKVVSSPRSIGTGQISPHRDRTSYTQVPAQSRLLLTHKNEDYSTNTRADPLTAGVGTASYAAPEQVDTTTYGSAADIYSLGLILLELLCCFSTEHERLQTFDDCRTRRIVPNDIVKKYPVAHRTILVCTEPIASKRPRASDLELVEILVTKTTPLLLTYDQAIEAPANELKTSNHPSDLRLVLDGLPKQENISKNVLYENDTILQLELEDLRNQVQTYQRMLDENETIIASLRREVEELKSASAPI